MTAVAIALLVLSLFLIPLGLPGLWVMVGVLAIGAVYQAVGLPVLALVVLVATLAEVLEFIFVKRFNARYGGSRKAFWGAIVGGIIGVVVGVPVPVIGSIIGAFVGSFVGASMVTLAETRNLSAARRAGWGVTLGRAVAAVVKVFAGLVIVVVGSLALIAY